MHLICVLLAWLGGAFLETTAPKEWTTKQVRKLLTTVPGRRPPDPSRKYRSTWPRQCRPSRPKPKLARRSDQAAGDDYLDYIRQEGLPLNVVLAIAYKNWTALEDAKESRAGCRMNRL